MAKEFKTAKELFTFIVDSITLYEQGEKNAIAFQLLEHFQISRTAVLTHKEIRFSEIEQLQTIIDRINQSEPWQYIIGETEFYGRKFSVTKAVLIPRPETEELVDKIIKEHAGKQGLKILDIGTGSGCIPITLMKELQNAEVYGVDISEGALEIAKQNAQKNVAAVDLSLFDIIHQSSFKTQNFDLIVSNPPYIALKEKKEMHSNVLEHEPHLALFVPDSSPLLFYSKILAFAQTHLKKCGCCYFEINEKYGKDVSELMRKEHFTEIRIEQDLNGKDRFAIGKLLK